MIHPWADQSRAAVTPRIAPAKIKNQRVPWVWWLAREKGEREILVVLNSHIRPERTDVESITQSTLDLRIQLWHGSGWAVELTKKRVSRGPSTKIGRRIRGTAREGLIGSERTIVNSSTDKTSEGKCGIEDTVCSVRQGDVLKTTSPQVGYGRKHPDGGEAKSRERNQRKRHRMRRGERTADQVIPTNTTWVIGDLPAGTWVRRPCELELRGTARTCKKQEAPW